MTEPGNIVKENRFADSHEQTSAPPSGSAGDLAGILDRFMAGLQAGEMPDKRRLIADHPELAAQLEGCLAGIELIHRKRRKVVLSAAIAAVAVILLIVGGWMSWRFYAEWRLGRIELTNDGIPLTVQVLSESGEDAVGEPIDLVRRSMLALPDGDYRLRVSAVGRLSETFRFAVNRGETQSHLISLEDSRLVKDRRIRLQSEKHIPEKPMLFVPMTVALEVKPGVADLVEWSGDALIRRDGVTGGVIWDARRPEKPFAPAKDPAAWIKPITGAIGEVTIVEPAFDLDGDGLADLISALPRTSSVLALSGKDGSMLWNYTAELEGAGGPHADGPNEQRPGRLIGVPAVVDCDRDGTPDLIATLGFSEPPDEMQRRIGPVKPGAPNTNQVPHSARLVVAVSGRSGRWIWSHRLDKGFTAVPEQSWKRAATVVPGRASPTVAILDDTRLKRLDPASGRPLGEPIEIGSVPIRDVQHADLDGDGEPDLVALLPAPPGQQQTLAAFGGSSHGKLWQQTVMAPYRPANGVGPWPDWPLVVDLDGDGRCEVVVPDSGFMGYAGKNRAVKIIDGSSGRTRWVRPMRPDTRADDRVEHVAAAPDLDRDGTHDLVIVSRFDGRQPAAKPKAPPPALEAIYVDAISGRDGHPLWWRRVGGVGDVRGLGAANDAAQVQQRTGLLRGVVHAHRDRGLQLRDEDRILGRDLEAVRRDVYLPAGHALLYTVSARAPARPLPKL